MLQRKRFFPCCLLRGMSDGTANTLGDSYEVVSKVHEVGLTNVKIAFVDRRPEHIEYDLFGETIALNRGITCKVLKKTTEAEAWLLSI